MKTIWLVGLVWLGLLGSQARAAEAPPSPPLGQWRVWQNRAILYTLELREGGTYAMFERNTNKPLGEGKYQFDGKTGIVSWTSGPHADQKYTGDFRTDHRIRLNLTFFAYNEQDRYAPSDDSKPRLGVYHVRPGAFGILLLENGKYQALDFGNKPMSDGEFSFDAREGIVKWLSGYNKDKGYRGTFSIEQKLILDDKKSIYAEFVPAAK